MSLVIAGTGHRPNKITFNNQHGYAFLVKRKLHEFAVNILKDKFPQEIYVISGMAQGWDWALATACIELNIPWTAAVPFKGQEEVWPAATQREYKELISKATRYIIVVGGNYAPWKMQTRNEWMVNNCDILLALYNGDASGGTYNCIEYAKSKNKEILNVWDCWLDFSKKEKCINGSKETE